MSMSPREWLEKRLAQSECGHDLRRRIRRLLAECDRGECPNPAQAIGKLYDEFKALVAADQAEE